MKTVEVSGMSCGMCVKHVTSAINSVEGVSGVEVSLEKGVATFELGEAPMESVIAAIEEEGYEAREI